MGKRAELEGRRRLVSEAAWRILVRDGLAELSVRNVAAEAGLAPSSLRYIFPTQASVREQAVLLVHDRLTSRVAKVPDVPGSPECARAVLLELLPLDVDRRMEMEVYLALGTAAMTDPLLRATHRQTHRLIRTVCSQVIEALLTLPSGQVHDVETDRLHGLVDGLALHLVRQQPDADTSWALKVLDTHLTQLGRQAEFPPHLIDAP